MGFGALSSAHQIMIRLALEGGPEYAAQMETASAETGLLGRSMLKTSAAMQVATRRSWMHNQSLYTMRRYAFYATLAVSALVYEVFRLGFSYNSTVQSAKVALRGMFDTKAAMDSTIKTLYRLSTFSPFLFKDTLTAFRTMAPAMKNAGVPVTTTLHTMKAVMDALSQSGHTSVGNLTRVSIQLQHLANIGRPTGQVLLALARDGLPVYPALRKELGLTGTSLENLSASGLTAKQVIAALNKFIETSPIYAGQAYKQATKTLQGNWQMFKDILAQAAGTSEGGMFAGLTHRMKAINDYLKPLVTSGKPVGLYQIAQAIDHALTPSSHLFLNLFVTISTVLKTVVTILGAMTWLLSHTIGEFGRLGAVFGIGGGIAKMFGIALGTIISLFIIGKAVLFPFILMVDLWKGTVVAAETVSTMYAAILAVLNGEWATAWGLITGNTVAQTENTGAVYRSAAARAELFAAMDAEIAGLTGETVALEAATGAEVGFGAAMWAMLGPIGLVLAGLALMIYYHKQIAAWAPVKGLTSFIQHPIRGAHNIKKHPGHALHSLGLGLAMETAFGPFGAGLGALGHHLHIPSFAAGGYSSGGMAMVGEGGPELVHLPAGSSVHPLGRAALAGAGSLSITVIPQDIYLDSKKIATVMATAVTDKEARMTGRNA